MARLLFILTIFIFSCASFAEVDPKLLSIETLKRLERVPEFSFIQQKAEELGVKVYLFGGTASAFAHYVRWDLEREAGDAKYQKERFDYDFTNIYRGNQDLDIVVDGTEAQAIALRQILERKYPHFVGSKDAWEVRLLKSKMGDKLPLLNDYDFLNQHTDTNSTGMIAVNPSKGGSVFRDLFDWKNSHSRFLKDVAAGRIKFLFSEKHETTQRFKSKQNPPVLAALRYIAKLAQYEVKGTKKDLLLVRKIIEDADWKAIEKNAYVKHKLTVFGLKALLNAPDSEYAWNLLETVGIRTKLIELDHNKKSDVDSLAWWMNKEPLRSKPIGEGEGKTARELFEKHLNKNGELIIAHETQNFLAYENITRSSKGRANVFISRNAVEGEAAVYGNGFYTKIGTEGARKTGITIRFKLDPNAKEGSDFTYNQQHDFIVITNKNVLSLIPENLNLSLLDFIRLMETDVITSSDQGLIEKLSRKFGRYHADLEEMREISKYILSSKEKTFDQSFHKYWFSNPESVKFRKILEITLAKGFSTVIKSLMPYEHWTSFVIKNFNIEKEINNLDDSSAFYLIEYVFSNPEWSFYPELVFALIKKFYNHDRMLSSIVKFILSKPYWNKHPKILIDLITHPDLLSKDFLLHEILNLFAHSSHWQAHPQIIKKLIQRVNTKLEIIVNTILVKPEWITNHELISFAIKTLDSSGGGAAVLAKLLSSEQFIESPHLITEYMNQNQRFAKYVAEYILSEPHWYKHHPELYSEFVKNNAHMDVFISKVLSKDFFDDESIISLLLEEPSYTEYMVEHVLSKEEWKNPKVIEKIVLENEQLHGKIVEFILSKRYWKDETGILDLIILDGNADHEVAQFALPMLFLNKRETIDQFINEGRATDAIIKFVLSKKQFKHTAWIEKLIEKGQYLHLIAKHVLSKEFWRNEKDLIMRLIKTREVDASITRYILSDPYWENYPEFLSEIISQGNADEAVVSYVFPKYGWKNHSHELMEIIENTNLDDLVLKKAFRNVNWASRPEIMVKLVTSGFMSSRVLDRVLKKPEWSKNPVLKDYLGRNKVNTDNIRNLNREIPFESFIKNSCGLLL